MTAEPGAHPFFWSISWPELELAYVSPSARHLLDDGNLQGSITAAHWARSVLFSGQAGELGHLWDRGWCEFDFCLDRPESSKAVWFRCRASLARDRKGRPRHIDGVAVPRGAAPSPPDTSRPTHRLSDLAFASIPVDDDLHVLDWPFALAQATGISPAHAIGRPLAELLQLFRPFMSPANGDGERALLDGDLVFATAGRSKLFLQHTATIDAATRECSRYIFATMLKGEEAFQFAPQEAGLSQLTGIVGRSPDELLLVDSSTFKILALSHGARTALGRGHDGSVEPLHLHELSYDLFAALRSRAEYLQLGCALAVSCDFETTRGRPHYTTAHVRLWEFNSAGILVIRLRPHCRRRNGRSAACGDDCQEGNDPGLGAILVNRRGEYQVLTGSPGMSRIELDGLFGGSSLSELTFDGEAVTSVIERGFEGETGNIHLAPSGFDMMCALTPLRDDAGATVALVGTLDRISLPH